MPTNEPLVSDNTLGKVVKGAGELAVPGLSLMLDKQYKSGILHTLAGLVAGAVFGPIGYVVVAADSFLSAETGKSLLDRVESPRHTPIKAAR